jgi:DNA (cytosine-5)-methyltransferase 1
VLNFSDEGESIFSRKKPLSDKTLERIMAGLMKYVANGDKSFISKYYSGKPNGKNISVDGPAGTLTCVDGQALVQTKFLLKYNSMNKDGVHTPPSVEEPSPVVSCQGRLGLVQPEFLDVIYGNGYPSGINSPAPTIRTKDGLAIVQPKYFIDKHFGSFAQNQSINQPCGTIMPNDKHRLVETVPFIMPTAYDNVPKSIEDPAPTLTASRRHHYIVNPSHGGHSTSTDNPCPVIVARQDKAPLYLVQAEGGNVAIPIYSDDTEISISIKQFMVIYGLSDIKMRMLRVAELLQIQGFPLGYQLEGNQSDQKKFIGNSVVPQVVKAWTEAMALKIINSKKKVA